MNCLNATHSMNMRLQEISHFSQRLLKSNFACWPATATECINQFWNQFSKCLLIQTDKIRCITTWTAVKLWNFRTLLISSQLKQQAKEQTETHETIILADQLSTA